MAAVKGDEDPAGFSGESHRGGQDGLVRVADPDRFKLSQSSIEAGGYASETPDSSPDTSSSKNSSCPDSCPAPSVWKH
jgi:hypothetical protein